MITLEQLGIKLKGNGESSKSLCCHCRTVAAGDDFRVSLPNGRLDQYLNIARYDEMVIHMHVCYECQGDLERLAEAKPATKIITMPRGATVGDLIFKKG